MTQYNTLNVKLSHSQLNKLKSEIKNSTEVPLLKTAFNLIGNVLLATIVLIPLRLTVAASATDAGIHKNKFGSGTTTLIISNEKMNDIIKIV